MCFILFGSVGNYTALLMNISYFSMNIPLLLSDVLGLYFEKLLFKEKYICIYSFLICSVQNVNTEKRNLCFIAFN